MRDVKFNHKKLLIHFVYSNKEKEKMNKTKQNKTVIKVH